MKRIRTHKGLIGMVGRLVAPAPGMTVARGLDGLVSEGETGLVVNGRWEVDGGAPYAVLTVAHERATVEYHDFEVELAEARHAA